MQSLRSEFRRLIGSVLADPQIEVRSLVLASVCEDLAQWYPGVHFAPEVGAIVADLQGLALHWSTKTGVEPRISGSLRVRASPRRLVCGDTVLPLGDWHPGLVGVRASKTEVTDALVFVGRDETLRPLAMTPLAYLDAVRRTRGAWNAAMACLPADEEAYVRRVGALFGDLRAEDLTFLRELL